MNAQGGKIGLQREGKEAKKGKRGVALKGKSMSRDVREMRLRGKKMVKRKNYQNRKYSGRGKKSSLKS